MPKAITMTDPVVIPVDVLAGHLGAAPEFVHSWLDRLNLTLIDGRLLGSLATDPAVQGLPPEKAQQFLAEVRAEVEAHDRRWSAYVAYRNQRRSEAVEEQERKAKEAREAVMADARRRARKFEAQKAEEAAREAAQKAAQKAGREGQPVSFEQFVRSA